MTRKFFLPLLAIIGALFGLYVVFWSQKEVPIAPILFPPPVSPYVHSIAGEGIIEASSQNLAIGTPFNEVVVKVNVIEGDTVKKGDTLFELDTRFFESQVAIAEANLNAAKVNLENQKVQFSFYQRLKDTKAVSEQLFQQSHYAFLVADENIKVAQANLEAAKVNVDRSIIKAPMDGVVLQVNVHVGELASVNPFISPASEIMSTSLGTLIVMGRIEPMQIRIDIDQEDAWRYEKGAKATAFVRGNSHINFPLTFSRIEPYIIPKPVFTGDVTERIDTRVLQVLYNFEKEDLSVYVGQLMDVFIESKSPETLISHEKPL